MACLPASTSKKEKKEMPLSLLYLEPTLKNSYKDVKASLKLKHFLW